MSWKATAYVKPLKAGPPKEGGAPGDELTRSEKFLLFILADYHNEEERCAWPSGSTLASDALMSLRYVWMLLESLRAKRLICIERREEKSGDKGTNRYRFHALDCGGDHKPGSELGAPPERPRKAKGGSETSSLPSEMVSLGSELASSPGSDPPITTLVNPGSLGSELASSHEPPSEPSGEPQASRHTHTDAPALPFGAAPARDGVRVSEESNLESEKGETQGDLTFDDYRAFARAHESFTAPDAWAAIHFNLRDEASAQLVHEWKAGRSPERVERERAAPPDTRMTYFEAAQVVRSISEVHGRDPCAVVEELGANGQLGEGVRERLLERFAAKGAGA